MWDAPWHWVVLAIVVIALFGYKRLPDAARSLGRSMRIFKTEVKGMGEDDKKRSAAKRVEPQALEAARAEGAGVRAPGGRRCCARARPRRRRRRRDHPRDGTTGHAVAAPPARH